MARKVLVVDDAMFMRVQLTNILVQAGYEVTQATNGAEAVQMSAAERPDITLMDLTMPIMDGLEAMKAILGADPSAKIVVCSAMGQTNMVLQAVQCGAKDFIVKPFQGQRVLASVQQHIGS